VGVERRFFCAPAPAVSKDLAQRRLLSAGRPFEHEE